MKNFIEQKQTPVPQQGFNHLSLKDKAVTSLLGVGVVLVSVACFILLLYLLTIVIRLLFVL